MEASLMSSSEGVDTLGFSISSSGRGSNNDCSVSRLKSLEEGSTSSSYTKVSSNGSSSFTVSGRGRGAVKLAKGSRVGVGSDVAEAGSVDTVSSCWVAATSEVATPGWSMLQVSAWPEVLCWPHTMGHGNVYCSYDPSTHSRGTTSFGTKQA